MFRSEVLAFAQQFPTANVRRAVALCEAGTLTWEQVHTLFTRSLGSALSEVSK